MKLTRDDVYILGKNAVDNARIRYYQESGPDVSGSKIMDSIIADLTRVRDMFVEVEKAEEDYKKVFEWI